MTKVESFEEFMSYVDWNDLEIEEKQGLYDVANEHMLDVGIFKLEYDETEMGYYLIDTMHDVRLHLTPEQKLYIPRWLEGHYMDGEDGEIYFSLQEELQKDSEAGVIEYQDSDDLENIQVKDVIVYSRDWTVQTIVDQINQKNIELNPNFQRRNAWNDTRRSRLIESIMMGYPIPEIILATDPKKKGCFIVIDGKQRLLTLAGFINPTEYSYWDKPRLKDLTVKKTYNGSTYNDISQDVQEKNNFNNTSLRCSVITNYNDDQVLYDIFYRLNTGSSPLSSQELRQALHVGAFSDYLLETTSKTTVLHKIMGLKAADNRLRDVEVLLRIYAFLLDAPSYQGNLRKFLDNKLEDLNNLWKDKEEEFRSVYNRIDAILQLLCEMFDGEDNVSRKWSNGNWDRKFNRVILEVLIFYLYHIDEKLLRAKDLSSRFVQEYQELCSNDLFRATVDSSTKSLVNYRIRYEMVQDIVNKAFEVQLSLNPFKTK